MKDSQNITIGFLLITAAVLSAMLISTYSLPSAKADSSITSGDYIFVTGPYSSSTDLLYVLNRTTARLNVYAINPRTGTIDVVDTVDILKGFEY